MLSPCTIVIRSKIDYNKHCKLQFRTYVQVHEQHNNSMVSRPSRAITLCPMGYAQGSYVFLSLNSGKLIVRNNWATLPMPVEVIATVHQIAKACKKYKGIVYTNKDGYILTDDNYLEQENIEITGVHINRGPKHNRTNEQDTNKHGPRKQQ